MDIRLIQYHELKPCQLIEVNKVIVHYCCKIFLLDKIMGLIANLGNSIYSHTKINMILFVKARVLTVDILLAKR